MARVLCDFRLLLLVAAVIFIYIQMRLFAIQSQYVDRLAVAIEAENHCTSQMRSLIDQISLQQGCIVALQGSLFILAIFSTVKVDLEKAHHRKTGH